MFGPAPSGFPTSPSTRRLSDAVANGRWRLRQAILGHRRLLAFVLAVAAVLAGFRATAAPVDRSTPVVVAARDLGAGVTLGPADLRVVDVATATAPDGRARSVVGRVLAGPMRRGEVVTDARLVGPALTTGRPGLVTTPVRFPDAGMVELLRVGDRIDVLAADAQGGEPAVVARGCPVLALPATDAGADAAGLVTTTDGGRLVVLGVPEAEVTAVSGAAISHFLTFTYAG